MLATNYQRLCYPISTVLVKIKLKVNWGESEAAGAAGRFLPLAGRVGVLYEHAESTPPPGEAIESA